MPYHKHIPWPYQAHPIGKKVAGTTALCNGIAGRGKNLDIARPVPSVQATLPQNQSTLAMGMQARAGQSENPPLPRLLLPASSHSHR